jgi:two-component system, NtrC family, sensor kinase
MMWPIRVKLLAGLSLVVAMVLPPLATLIFGLHSLRTSIRAQDDQGREMATYQNLLKCVTRLSLPQADFSHENRELKQHARDARRALIPYFETLKSHSTQHNQIDGGDELAAAFLIDHDLTTILANLDPDERLQPALPGTAIYLIRHPEVVEAAGDQHEHAIIAAQIDRINRQTEELHLQFLRIHGALLESFKRQIQSMQVIVWTSAVFVLAMLCGLAVAVQRWLLFPMRRLLRGVRHVARGSFAYTIDLKSGDVMADHPGDPFYDMTAKKSGDEMADLAEAFNDMTAKISTTYADLEHQVQERSRALCRSERLAGVGFLTSVFAHEINNPLASIAFCAEAMDHRLDRLLTASDHPDQRVLLNYLRMIQEEAFRCKNMTEVLLDVSRSNDTKREAIDLARLTHGVVEMVRHIGKWSDKAIEFQPNAAVVGHVNSQQIKQVVLTLVVNALNSMDAGGTLRIDIQCSQGFAKLVFADNGHGMNAEALEKVFEPFSASHRVGKGTGQGLSFTRRIVLEQGGEISAISHGEGRGTTITVLLPTDPTRNDSYAGLDKDAVGTSAFQAQTYTENRSVKSPTQPRYPRLWRFFSLVLPPETRTRVFEPSFQELLADYIVARTQCRTKWGLHWLTVCFTCRTILMVIQCLRAMLADRFFRWVSNLVSDTHRNRNSG